MENLAQKKLYAITYPQKSIILTEQFFNDPHISTISGYVIIKDSVNFELLEKAIITFIKNNDATQIRFTNIGGEIKQYFESEELIEIEKLQINAMNELEDILNNHTFSLFDSKLYYAVMYETKDKKQGYAFCVHHSITDAWSETILITQINQIYDKLLNNESIDDMPKTSYLDIINSEESYLFSDKFVKDKTYWEQNFNEVCELSEIRTAKNKFDTIANRLAIDIPQKYFDYCSENKLSPFSLFLSAIFIYFSRIYNNQTMVIGTPVLNRTNFLSKSVFGMFISTQPFKQFVDDNITVSSFIENVTSTQFSLLRHQKYPFEMLQKYYSEHFDRTHNLYDILFSYQNARVDTTPLSFNFESKWIFSGRQADALDISIFDIDNTGNQQIGYDYLTSIYTKEDILDIHNRIFYLLDQIITNPNQLVKDLEIVTPNEKDFLVNEANQTFKEYDKTLTIAKLFEEQALNNPDKIALSYDNKDMTYKELNEKANYLANILRNNGIKNNDIVGIMTYRSFEMIISQLAILKAGAAYLPIDPAYPEERITYILSDSKCPILLTTSQIKTDSFNIPTLTIDVSTLGVESNLPSITTPNDLAYVIYTSGSTGKPKGVMIRQLSIVNTLLWRKETYQFDSSFITMQIPSFSFDSSVEDIFTTLISGGHLVLLKQNNTNFNLPNIKEIISKYKINHFLAVPSFYNILLDELSEELKYAKCFTVAGEGFSEELVKKHFKLLPNVKLYNEYGPTENSVCSTYYQFTPECTEIFIGKPIYNCSCYVLNSNLKLQPFNTKGELYLSGPGLSKGYIGRDDLTSSRFIQNPFKPNELMYKTGDIVTINKDGNLTFIERADFQVKFNGYRINLGEIESTISKYISNPNVVALLKKYGNHSAIAAYIETKNKIDIPSLKKELIKFLPYYMVPTEIYLLDSFPTTPNGKIDRQALEQISTDIEEIEIIKPRNDLDTTILEIWKQVLKLDTISIESNIFDLGGDSLAIISIQSMLFKRNIHTKVQDLFEYTTIRELSDFIKKQEQNNQNEKEIKAFPRLYQDNLSDEKQLNLEKNNFPNHVLLTGVTGFLGIHVLNELLKTNETTRIYCIIRERPNKTATKRLKESLEFYFDGKWINEIDNRIIVLKGDLSREMFGLNPTLYRDLLVKIDSIINSASLVKHFGTYDSFYNSNVLSVEHIIKFAKEAGCTINHISTTSVSGNYLVKNDISYRYTENDFYIGQNYMDNVYVRTKFEAEAKLFKAQQENVTVNIFRMGNIMPRIVDGKFQHNKFENAYYKRIYGFIQLGVLPENLKEQELEFTPVDSSAEAIVKLICYKNKVFHLLSDKTIKLTQFIKVLNNLGNTIQFTSIENFNDTIKNNTSNEILESFITDLDYKNTLDYNSKIIMTNDITNHYFNLENISWPEITDEYIENLIEDMIH